MRVTTRTPDLNKLKYILSRLKSKLKYPRNRRLNNLSAKIRFTSKKLRHPIVWHRINKRERELEGILGRKPSFGDMFADSMGLTVEDPIFQSVIRDTLDRL